jgi:peptidyl-prolyl cis-trans isomerase SurA
MCFFYRFYYVLKKPKSNLEDIQQTQLFADSIYQKIMDGEFSFEHAVGLYSTDIKTRNSAGLIQNIMDQSDIFTVNQVMQYAKSHPDIAYVRDIIFSFSGAEEGSITYPSLVINSDQNRVIQIAKLDKRITSHSANLDHDYVLIEQLTKHDLEQAEIKKWANKMIKKNYIEMNSNYESCPFVYNWK